MTLFNSPFSPDAPALDVLKFRDENWTATGERRASVRLEQLRILWFNTGSLCELACAACYVESSPSNDTLLYLTRADVVPYLDEIRDRSLPTETIGLTGGEPFINQDIVPILDICLTRGFRTLVLTGGLRSMRRHETGLSDLLHRFGRQFCIRVSIDDYERSVHDAERGIGTFGEAVAGLVWLNTSGFCVSVAGRYRPGADEAQTRAGFAALFAQLGLSLDADDPAALTLLPEMDADADTCEIGESSWMTLKTGPSGVMCAFSRMVVRRRGEAGPRVVACPLLPYDLRFDLGGTLATARRTVALNHPHCARFCILGRGRLHG